MTSTFVSQTQTTTTEQKSYKADYLFVVQLHDGTYVIGAANNPAKRISSINTGYNSAVPKSNQIHRIVGIKEQNEERTLISVVKKFCETYGENKVIVV